MQSSELPLTQDVVLIGGGHTHALVLRRWAMTPLPGARLTLINPHPTAPYTGMLPGFVAGHYARGELDIDLIKLARAAGARIILDRATGIDSANHNVKLSAGRIVRYDAVSIDIGITAPKSIVDDPAQALVPIKPMDQFADAWSDFCARARAGETGARVNVIGAGIGGVEIALAAKHALRDRADCQVTLIDRSTPLTAQSTGLRRSLMAQLARAGIALISGVETEKLENGVLRLSGGQELPSDFTISTAGAAPYKWLAHTDLPLVDGFISVGPTLQVTGQTHIFAVGDCAHLTHAPRPKAGVFAVRAAPVLFDNIRACVSGGTLRAFEPQKDYLKIVSLGAQNAIAEKWGLRPKGRPMWRLKDRIDQKFMRQFRELPSMATPPLPVPRATDPDEMPANKILCAGCGAKVAPNVLKGILDDLATTGRNDRDDIVSAPGDDAAVLFAPEGRFQVITTDHLRAFSLDPFVMAKIAAVHAMGDIWAMGAQAQAALPHIILPRSSTALQADMMREIMAGALDILGPAGAEIVGGHSSVGAEMTIGFTLTGLVDKAIPQSGAQAGDVLILTKRIGSGTLLAAEMAGQAEGAWIANLLDQMATPQGESADIMAPFANAMTDITGFGLAGHLSQMAQGAGLGATIYLPQVPFYQGAVELAKRGVRSSLYDANRAYVPKVQPTTAQSHLLFDPQTAGGLLASIPEAKSKIVLDKLREAGCPATQIGQMHNGPPSLNVVT